MSFAPDSVGFSNGDGSIIGSFYEKEQGNFFEYTSNNAADSWLDVNEFPHRVYVSNNPVNDSGWRYARVLKTVAYVVVDDMTSNCNGFRDAGGDAIQVDIEWTAEQAYNVFEAAATEYFGV